MRVNIIHIVTMYYILFLLKKSYYSYYKLKKRGLRYCQGRFCVVTSSAKNLLQTNYK